MCSYSDWGKGDECCEACMLLLFGIMMKGDQHLRTRTDENTYIEDVKGFRVVERIGYCIQQKIYHLPFTISGQLVEMGDDTLLHCSGNL